MEPVLGRPFSYMIKRDLPRAKEISRSKTAKCEHAPSQQVGGERYDLALDRRKQRTTNLPTPRRPERRTDL